MFLSLVHLANKVLKLKTTTSEYLKLKTKSCKCYVHSKKGKAPRFPTLEFFNKIHGTQYQLLLVTLTINDYCDDLFSKVSKEYLIPARST